MTFSPKVKTLVTRPVLKFEKDKPFHVRILAALFYGTAPTPRPGSTRAPVRPGFVDVVNLETRSEATLPIHSKLFAIIDAKYPGGMYVGKCFSITANQRKAGVQFSPYSVVEIEDPDAEEKTVSGEASAPTNLHAAGGKRK